MAPSFIFQPSKFRRQIPQTFKKWTLPHQNKFYYSTISISLLAIILLLVCSFHRYPYPRSTTTATSTTANDLLSNEQQQQQNKKRGSYMTTDDWSYSRVPYFDTIMDTVDLHFPGSMPSWTAVQSVKSVLMTESERFYGVGPLTPTNTLFAQSICPDEVNHEPGNSIPNLFAEYFGKVFHLGGLGAIPFTGKTGFAAYASHVPHNGHLFVLLAPHIGISDNGRHLGQYARAGQTTTTTQSATDSSQSSSSSHSSSSLSPCCGAAIGALGIPDMAARHQQHQTGRMTTDDNDQEMAYLVQQINLHKHEILSTATSENAMLANLARVNHNIALDYLHKIVHAANIFGSDNDSNSSNSTLVILTGIQINMPRPALQEFFQPLSFTIQYQNGTIYDLFNETFVNNGPLQKVVTKKKRPKTRQRLA
jgi:Limiting CO2-inducible proteins B/C beta carbonyic anhydrases